MGSSEGDGVKIIQIFNGENFHLWKFKMEMVLEAMDLWEIVEGTEDAPTSGVDAKGQATGTHPK